MNTIYIQKCLVSLELAYEHWKLLSKDDRMYDIFRAACIKEFELILEQSGKLLKKALKPYFATSKELDRLTYKDIFRHAAKYSLIELEETERWFLYRDSRNETAHEYGEDLAEKTMNLLPDFICDTKKLILIIENQNENS
jgi:nucleotidyltransferase substrate binding protein (TIGR01987 family)